MKRATTKWTLKDATKLTKWDKRIQVTRSSPLFQYYSGDLELDEKIVRQMDFIERSGLSGMSNIFHVKV